MTRTIYSLSSPLGKAGVAVVRVSGSAALKTLEDLTKLKNPQARKAIFTSIISPRNHEVLDRGLVLYFKGPESFTGFDVVEFHLHGSLAVIKGLLEELSLLPYLNLAEPGEFTRQAFEEGKMDLLEVEALKDLIEAETKLERQQALYQMSGHLTRLYGEWRDRLIAIIAKFEAYIDFPDDDLPEEILKISFGEAEGLAKDLEDHLIKSKRASRLLEGVSIAIGGPPNAGKSSILNLLAQEEVAIVSDKAGTTRDLIKVKLEIKGLPVTLYDTAGIRELPSDEIEKEGIRRAKTALESAFIKIYVFDITKLEEMEKFPIEEEQSLIILNKCDLPIDQKKLDSLKRPYLLFSSQKAYNLDKLLEILGDLIGQSSDLTSNFTRQARQQESLARGLDYLKMLHPQKDLEVNSQDLREALRSLEHLLGKITLDEVLDKIFTSFCIGK
jgi:tRNA modification GTPase